MIWTGSYRDDRLVSWLYSLAAMFLAVIAVIVLLSITANSAGRFIKDWRYITDAYIDAQASPTGERGTVSQVVRAHKPENFTEELELVTFGEGTHFSVHSHPDMGNGDIVTQVATIDEVRIGKRPLPYPPQSMWCVYLQYAEKQNVMIFLGYHKDMYSAEWVAHIGEQTPFSKAFTKLLAQIECEFPSITE